MFDSTANYTAQWVKSTISVAPEPLPDIDLKCTSPTLEFNAASVGHADVSCQMQAQASSFARSLQAIFLLVFLVLFFIKILLLKMQIAFYVTFCCHYSNHSRFDGCISKQHFTLKGYDVHDQPSQNAAQTCLKHKWRLATIVPR